MLTNADIIRAMRIQLEGPLPPMPAFRPVSVWSLPIWARFSRPWRRQK